MHDLEDSWASQALVAVDLEDLFRPEVVENLDFTERMDSHSGELTQSSPRMTLSQTHGNLSGLPLQWCYCLIGCFLRSISTPRSIRRFC